MPIKKAVLDHWRLWNIINKVSTQHSASIAFESCQDLTFRLEKFIISIEKIELFHNGMYLISVHYILRTCSASLNRFAATDT